MPLPDMATLHALQLEMNAVGFVTGTQAAEDMAWESAWDQAETLAGTNLLTGTVADERHVWPRGWTDYDAGFRYLQLNNTHIVSALTATLIHDLGSCTCETDDVSACFIMYSPRRAEVQVRAESAGISLGCACVSCGLEAYVDVTYVAGLWNTPADLPADVRLALATLAQDWKRLMLTAGATAADGFVTQWSSMDYSERRGLLRRTAIGTSPAQNLAANVFRKYKINRMVGLRGRPTVSG